MVRLGELAFAQHALAGGDLVRLLFVPFCVAAMLVSACNSTVGLTPPQPASQSVQSDLQFSPETLYLTPDAPSDTFNGQGDVAGVTYTADALSSCVSSTGSIVVGGNGAGQLDVAGSPLLFTVVAVGTTPPATCEILVNGSDGSSASVTVNYSNTPVSDIPYVVRRTSVTPGVTPNALSFTSLVAQEIAVSGLSGTITPNVICKSTKSGVTLGQNDATDFTVIPWGQGTIANTCTITLTDTSKNSVTVSVAMSIGAMAKMKASPTNVQFGCTGSSAP
jgi:hypothetical protein